VEACRYAARRPGSPKQEQFIGVERLPVEIRGS
jgi:hypothetical protein